MIRKLSCLALLFALLPTETALGQTAQEQPKALVRQQLEEIAINFPNQIRKIDEPAIRVFLKLRIARLLWTEREVDFRSIAQSLTVAALEEIDAEQDRIPQSTAGLFRKDLLGLLEANAPEIAKKYARDDIGVAFSLLGSKGKAGLAVEILDRQLANGWSPDSTILFFLYRLETQQPAELTRALSMVLSAEERTVGTISVEVLMGLADFCLRRNTPTELRRRFVTIAVNATSQSYTLSDAKEVNETYNLLVAVLPDVKSLTPSLYAQAAAQLASLTSRVSQARTEREEIDQRIRTSSDPLSHTIAEARSANDQTLKDELFLQAARLALEKGKIKLSFELATSMSREGYGGKWREHFLNQLAEHAIEKKDSQIARAAITEIELPATKLSLSQKLALHFFESKDIWTARELLNDSLRIINGLENKTERTLALFRSLPVVLKVNDGLVPLVADQTVKSINSVPSVDRTSNEKTLNEYVQKTLLPLTWQALVVFQSLSERDENSTLDLAHRIQLGEIRTAALLGVAMGRLEGARIAAQPKRKQSRVNKATQH